jgi:hypothetical protein
MARETVITLQIIGALMVASALLLLIVPAENIWPWVFLFTSVGVGLCVGPGFAPYKRSASVGQARSEADN